MVSVRTPWVTNAQEPSPDSPEDVSASDGVPVLLRRRWAGGIFVVSEIPHMLTDVAL